MLHFVVNPYDPSLKYDEICEALFGDGKCLVMLERKNGGDHAHVQGELKPGANFAEVQRKMIDAHYKTQMAEKSGKNAPRPVKKRKREADEQGFQYMCKEYDVDRVVYQQGFEDGELYELYKASEEHRDELKGKLGEYIIEAVGSRRSGESVSELHKRCALAAFDYYLDQGKMDPPNIKLLVRHFMKHNFSEHADVRSYIVENFYI